MFFSDGVWEGIPFLFFILFSRMIFKIIVRNFPMAFAKTNRWEWPRSSSGSWKHAKCVRKHERSKMSWLIEDKSRSEEDVSAPCTQRCVSGHATEDWRQNIRQTLANFYKLWQTLTHSYKLGHLRPGQWTWGGALKQAAAKMRQFLTRWGHICNACREGFLSFHECCFAVCNYPLMITYISNKLVVLASWRGYPPP